MNESKCFVSVYVATNRPNNIYEFCRNLYELSHSINNFEILIAVDKGDLDTLKSINQVKHKYGLNISVSEFIASNGYFSLDVGYNSLIPLASEHSYFDWLLNDEIRLQTKNWDLILKNYYKFFDDDIFRLRLSTDFKLKNYYDIFECMPSPDNYSIITRKWLRIIENWGECWGPDPWLECIDYFLRMDDGFCDNSGEWRSVPIFDITLSGEEANQRQSDEITMSKSDGISIGWVKFTSQKYQEIYLRFASLLKAEILRSKLNKTVQIHEDKDSKKIYVSNNGINIKSWSYCIQKKVLIVAEGYKKVKNLPINSDSLIIYADSNIDYPSILPLDQTEKNIVHKILNWATRILIKYQLKKGM